jgi:DinB superfamily
MPDLRPTANEHSPAQAKYVSLVHMPVMDTLRAQRDLMRGLGNVVNDEKASYRYAPEKWSVREVIGHIADAERVYQYRALALSRGETFELPPWDPDRYVEEAGFDSRTVADLIDEVLVVREATLAFFDHLPRPAWSKSGTLAGNPLSVRALAFIAAGHLQRHVDVLRERYAIDV